MIPGKSISEVRELVKLLTELKIVCMNEGLLFLDVSISISSVSNAVVSAKFPAILYSSHITASEKHDEAGQIERRSREDQKTFCP